MALILVSFEEYHGLECPKPEVWEQIRNILSAESDLHKDHIDTTAAPIPKLRKNGFR